MAVLRKRKAKEDPAVDDVPEVQNNQTAATKQRVTKKKKISRIDALTQGLDTAHTPEDEVDTTSARAQADVVQKDGQSSYSARIGPLPGHPQVDKRHPSVDKPLHPANESSADHTPSSADEVPQLVNTECTDTTKANIPSINVARRLGKSPTKRDLVHDDVQVPAETALTKVNEDEPRSRATRAKNAAKERPVELLRDIIPLQNILDRAANPDQSEIPRQVNAVGSTFCGKHKKNMTAAKALELKEARLSDINNHAILSIPYTLEVQEYMARDEAGTEAEKEENGQAALPVAYPREEQERMARADSMEREEHLSRVRRHREALRDYNPRAPAWPLPPTNTDESNVRGEIGWNFERDWAVGSFLDGATFVPYKNISLYHPDGRLAQPAHAPLPDTPTDQLLSPQTRLTVVNVGNLHPQYYGDGIIVDKSGVISGCWRLAQTCQENFLVCSDCKSKVPKSWKLKRCWYTCPNFKKLRLRQKEHGSHKMISKHKALQMPCGANVDMDLIKDLGLPYNHQEALNTTRARHKKGNTFRRIDTEQEALRPIDVPDLDSFDHIDPVEEQRAIFTHLMDSAKILSSLLAPMNELIGRVNRPGDKKKISIAPFMVPENLGHRTSTVLKIALRHVYGGQKRNIEEIWSSIFTTPTKSIPEVYNLVQKRLKFWQEKKDEKKDEWTKTSALYRQRMQEWTDNHNLRLQATLSLVREPSRSSLDEAVIPFDRHALHTGRSYSTVSVQETEGPSGLKRSAANVLAETPVTMAALGGTTSRSSEDAVLPIESNMRHTPQIQGAEIAQENRIQTVEEAGATDESVLLAAVPPTVSQKEAVGAFEEPKENSRGSKPSNNAHIKSVSDGMSIADQIRGFCSQIQQGHYEEEDEPSNEEIPSTRDVRVTLPEDLVEAVEIFAERRPNLPDGVTARHIFEDALTSTLLHRGAETERPMVPSTVLRYVDDMMASLTIPTVPVPANSAPTAVDHTEPGGTKLGEELADHSNEIAKSEGQPAHNISPATPLTTSALGAPSGGGNAAPEGRVLRNRRREDSQKGGQGLQNNKSPHDDGGDSSDDDDDATEDGYSGNSIKKKAAVKKRVPRKKGGKVTASAKPAAKTTVPKKVTKNNFANWCIINPGSTYKPGVEQSMTLTRKHKVTGVEQHNTWDHAHEVDWEDQGHITALNNWRRQALRRWGAKHCEGYDRSRWTKEEITWLREDIYKDMKNRKISVAQFRKMPMYGAIFKRFQAAFVDKRKQAGLSSYLNKNLSKVLGDPPVDVDVELDEKKPDEETQNTQEGGEASSASAPAAPPARRAGNIFLKIGIKKTLAAETSADSKKRAREEEPEGSYVQSSQTRKKRKTVQTVDDGSIPMGNRCDVGGEDDEDEDEEL